MSHHVDVRELPRGGEMLDLGKLSKLRLILLAIAAVGGIGSIIAFWVAPAQFAYSWLFAFAFFFTISIGGLFWLLLHHATNSGWGISVRRIFEQLANMIPWVGALGLPLLFPPVREALWDWMLIVDELTHGAESMDAARDALYAHHQALLAAKLPYLSVWWGAVPGWIPRFFLYFIILGFGAFWLRRYSLKQDRTAEVRPTLSARRFACGWLPLFAVCVTFAAVDWLMGLNFGWFSTMWGVYVFAGSALNAMAVTVITVGALRRLGYLKSVVTPEHFHLMGKLMLAFVIFWAYVGFSQYFLIWYANITEETLYFIIRNTEGWHIGSSALMWMHFVIPFLLLLPVWIKTNEKYLMMVAGWVLLAHVLDIYLIIVPERGPTIADTWAIPGAFWGDILAFITVGAVFIFLYLGTLGRHSLYACGDPRLDESVNVHN